MFSHTAVFWWIDNVFVTESSHLVMTIVLNLTGNYRKRLPSKPVHMYNY